jgi:predicted RNA-binding Zn-ribbon protein involved in translation (DUF1610 family)
MKDKFNEVAIKGSKTNVCPKCGKKQRRTQKFYQTLNPYNTNKEGFPKSGKEILAELLIEEARWKQERELCSGCEE